MAHDPNYISTPPDGKPYEQQPQWRQDFPIDVPQDNYIARRDFVKFMVLTSGAFAAGQVWIGLHNLWSRSRGKPAMKAILPLSELPVGGVVSFHYPTENEGCLLVRPDEATLLAYSQSCTHLACAVQPQMDTGRFHCPCHNGWFDMATGRPLSGPPKRPLPKITLEVRDGMIYATGVERSTS